MWRKIYCNKHHSRVEPRKPFVIIFFLFFFHYIIIEEKITYTEKRVAAFFFDYWADLFAHHYESNTHVILPKKKKIKIKTETEISSSGSVSILFLLLTISFLFISTIIAQTTMTKRAYGKGDNYLHNGMMILGNWKYFSVIFLFFSFLMIRAISFISFRYNLQTVSRISITSILASWFIIYNARKGLKKKNEKVKKYSEDK